jgi:hypothetical protein
MEVVLNQHRIETIVKKTCQYSRFLSDTCVIHMLDRQAPRSGRNREDRKNDRQSPLSTFKEPRHRTPQNNTENTASLGWDRIDADDRLSQEAPIL